MLPVGTPLRLVDSENLGDSDGAPIRIPDGLAVGLLLPLGTVLGLIDGELLGGSDGAADGLDVGSLRPDGLVDGEILGDWDITQSGFLTGWP
jgi:hypothetical protein